MTTGPVNGKGLMDELKVRQWRVVEDEISGYLFGRDPPLSNMESHVVGVCLALTHSLFYFSPCLSLHSQSHQPLSSRVAISSSGNVYAMNISL